MYEEHAMQAVVLEKKNSVQLRNIEIDEDLGPDDVRIKPVAVGICGAMSITIVKAVSVILLSVPRWFWGTKHQGL